MIDAYLKIWYVVLCSTMDFLRKTNPWWRFVKEHADEVKGLKTRKERFAALSEMWQNEKAELVTINGKYLFDIHTTNASLRKELAAAKEENKRLLETIQIMKDYRYLEEDDKSALGISTNS